MSSTTFSLSLPSVLVVGGCGFVGSHLVRDLLDNPTIGPVSVFSRNPDTNCYPNVSYHSIDISSSKEEIRALLDSIQPNIIFHTASPDLYADPPNHLQFERVNVHGTANLLACAKESASVVAFIYTSSLSVVRNDQNGECFMADKEAPLVQGPVNKYEPYQRSKAIADAMVRDANNDKAISEHTQASGCLRTVCIRMPEVYGEGDKSWTLMGIQLAKGGRGRFQLGDNVTLCDSLYVGNAVHGHLLAARGLLTGIGNPSAPKADGEAFHITDDNPCPFWNGMWKLYAAAGHAPAPHEIVVVPTGALLVFAILAEWVFWILFWGQRRPKMLVRSRLEHLYKTRTYSVEKAKRRLGWSPCTSVDDAVRSSARWGLEEYEAGNRKVFMPVGGQKMGKLA